MTGDLPLRLSAAIGIGLLIGLERGWRTRTVPDGRRAAGIRTFALSGLLGGVCATLADNEGATLSVGGGLVLAASILAYAAVMLVLGREQNRVLHNYSATTTVAAVLTFALGASCVLGDLRVAVGAGVVSAGILLLREALHRWLRVVTASELQAALLLLAMTFVILPVLPAGPVPRLGDIAVREIWLIAILLALVSFIGYLGARLFGERGSLFAAAAGGLVSSTAVTLASARLARAGEAQASSSAACAALASAVSYLRVVGLVAAVQPALVLRLGASLGSAAIVSVVLAALWTRRVRDAQPALVLRNPFSFPAVVIMAATMGVVILASRWLLDRAGSVGLYAGAAVTGLFDVDSLVVAVSRNEPLHASASRAAALILLAVFTSTCAKVVLAWVAGPRSFGFRTSVQGFVASAAAGAVFLLLP